MVIKIQEEFNVAKRVAVPSNGSPQIFYELEIRRLTVVGQRSSHVQRTIYNEDTYQPGAGIVQRHGRGVGECR